MLPGALLLFRKKDAGRAEKIWITLLVVLYWVMSAAGRHHQRGAIDKHARSPEVYVARGEFLEMYVPSRTGLEASMAYDLLAWVYYKARGWQAARGAQEEAAIYQSANLPILINDCAGEAAQS